VRRMSTIIRVVLPICTMLVLRQRTSIPPITLIFTAIFRPQFYRILSYNVHCRIHDYLIDTLRLPHEHCTLQYTTAECQHAQTMIDDR